MDYFVFTESNHFHHLNMVPPQVYTFELKLFDHASLECGILVKIHNKLCVSAWLYRIQLTSEERCKCRKNLFSLDLAWIWMSHDIFVFKIKLAIIWKTTSSSVFFFIKGKSEKWQFWENLLKHFQKWHFETPHNNNDLTAQAQLIN